MPTHSPVKGPGARKPGKVTTGGKDASRPALKPNMGDPNSKMNTGGKVKPGKTGTPNVGRHP